MTTLNLLKNLKTVSTTNAIKGGNILITTVSVTSTVLTANGYTLGTNTKP